MYCFKTEAHANQAEAKDHEAQGLAGRAVVWRETACLNNRGRNHAFHARRGVASRGILIEVNGGNEGSKRARASRHDGF